MNNNLVAELNKAQLQCAVCGASHPKMNQDQKNHPNILAPVCGPTQIGNHMLPSPHLSISLPLKSCMISTSCQWQHLLVQT